MSTESTTEDPNTDVPTTERVLAITDAAVAKILEIRADEDDAESLALRIEITGVVGVEYSYELSFELLAEAPEGAVIEQHGELTSIVPADSAANLAGATLDLPRTGGADGLVLRNPNRPSVFGDHGSLELTGDVAERIRQLLDRQVNPALAGHGGMAELIAVEGDVAYVRMGGGCQGCGMAAATLRNGIETAIIDAVPEIHRVVDTTDHAAGMNPYYEPAH